MLKTNSSLVELLIRQNEVFFCALLVQVGGSMTSAWKSFRAFESRTGLSLKQCWRRPVGQRQLGAVAAWLACQLLVRIS